MVKRLSYSQIADSVRRLYQFIEIHLTSLFAFSKMNFSIVNFSCDNSVVAIPNNWLIDSGSCYWHLIQNSEFQKLLVTQKLQAVHEKCIR